MCKTVVAAKDRTFTDKVEAFEALVVKALKDNLNRWRKDVQKYNYEIVSPP